ncbi:MAG: PRD domain-containing protein [Erysipelotrichaceae bacterium]
MYLVEKVLNNNAVLARRESDDQRVVVLQNGIGFGKSVGQVLPQQAGLQVYVLDTQDKTRNDLVYRVNPIFFEIASDIVTMLKKEGYNVEDKRMVALADHIAFAYERILEGIRLPNPFSQQIQVLYAKEYQFALQAKNIIESTLSIQVDDDEVGYLTLHIVAMLDEQDITQTLEIARVFGLCMQQIEQETQVRINPASLSYLRLITHLKMLVLRAERKETIDLDFTELIRIKHQQAYEVAQKVRDTLNQELRLQVVENEVGYLAIHIQRILQSEPKK